MSLAAALRSALALVALATGAWAAALTVVNEPSVTGAAAQFVTLGFSLEGSGDYDYTVLTPAGWEPLTRSGRVSLEGAGYVSVTLQVPRTAPAQSEAQVDIVFTNTEDPQDTVSGHGLVSVLGTVALELHAPTDLEGTLGEPFALSLLLVNRGNMVDDIALSGDGGMWDVRFEANPVRLEPGEERAVALVLVPQGQVSSGYLHMLRLRATSGNDPDVTASALVETVFYEASLQGAAEAGDDPRLTLSVRTGLAAGLTADANGWQPHLRYDVNPRLNGELSDYVDVSAGVGDLSGTIDDPFERVPSRFEVALDAQTWDASARVGNGGAALAGSGVVNDWRLGGSGSYQGRLQGDTFAVGAYAISQLPELDLQFSARSSLQAGGRNDSLGGRYRTSLGNGLVLGLGTSLSGSAAPAGYTVAVGLDQSLSYQAQSFDVTQSYSGVPAAGLHNIGVSGGLRTAGPFGVRASSSLQVSQAGNDWRHSVTLSSRPLPRVALSLAGSLRHADADATWSLRPSASVRYGNAALGGTFGVHYSHTGVLRGSAATLNTYGVSANLRSGGLTLATAASYGTSSRAANAPAGDWFEASFDASYTLGLRTEVTAGYEFEVDTVAGRQSGTGGVAWTQSWSRDVSSRLSYDRSEALEFTSGRSDRDERVALIGQFSNLGLAGLDLSAGYAISSNTGLLTGLTPLTHDLSARLGYTLLFSFDTPPTVVNLFGGRRGGEVSGVAYLDRNLNGVQDAGEEVIAGLELQLGGERAVTAADGSYSLRTGVGSYEWSFGSGLPGAVRLLNDGSVEVSENTQQRLDLAFSPVIRLPIMLFDDTDQDGVLDAGESGIPFGGVRLDGPFEVTIRVDGRGSGSATGLVPGRYVVTPDPAALPPRFRATGDPVVIELREGDTPATIALGAAAPPREVVTTFQAGNLAVIGRLNKSRAAVGDTLEVTALISGNAERVVAVVGGVEVELTGGGSMWLGEITVPAGITAGPTEVLIRATSTGVEAESVVRLEVTTSGER